MDEKQKVFGDIKNSLDARLDQIEEMLRLLLLGNVMNQMDEVEGEGHIEEEDDLTKFLSNYDFSTYKREAFGDNIAIYIMMNNKPKMKDIREARSLFHSHFINVIPVFVFDKINGMQKKKMEEEKISFYVIGREVHITG